MRYCKARYSFEVGGGTIAIRLTSMHRPFARNLLLFLKQQAAPDFGIAHLEP